LSVCPFSVGHCQHNDQKKRTEGQATQWPKEKGQKDKQHNRQQKRKEGQATQKLVIVLLVLLSFSFGHCVACHSVLFFWFLCCLPFFPFLLAIVLLVLLSLFFWPTQWPKEKDRRTSNTMAKGK
jgi:fatty acid desaturase